MMRQKPAAWAGGGTVALMKQVEDRIPRAQRSKAQHGCGSFPLSVAIFLDLGWL